MRSSNSDYQPDQRRSSMADVSQTMDSEKGNEGTLLHGSPQDFLAHEMQAESNSKSNSRDKPSQTAKIDDEERSSSLSSDGSGVCEILQYLAKTSIAQSYQLQDFRNALEQQYSSRIAQLEQQLLYERKRADEESEKVAYLTVTSHRLATSNATLIALLAKEAGFNGTQVQVRPLNLSHNLNAPDNTNSKKRRFGGEEFADFTHTNQRWVDDITSNRGCDELPKTTSRSI